MQLIKHLTLSVLLATALSSTALAEEDMTSMSHDMAKEHGGGVFHAFQLETDYGASQDDPLATWDLDGWVGTDENKLWIKSEGEHKDGKLEDAELWALYSRNIATFWDAQAGIRRDIGPHAATYAVFGINGLAPYFFETEAHLFVSDQGDVTARLRRENDLLLTQKLVLQHYLEVNLSAQDVPEHDIGAGITDGQLGVQLRYEFTRKFAPYVDIYYDRKFGETASIAEDEGEDKGGLTGAIGLRVMF